MERDVIEKALATLKARQARVDAALNKAGNRGLLEFFVEILPRALNVERCSIFIFDPSAGHVWLECGTGLRQRQVSVPKGDSLVGRVIASGEHQIETDMDNLVGPHGVVDMQTGFVTRNALCVPVYGVSRERVTGAIEVLNKRGGVFSDEDVTLLKRAAQQLQMNIENIFLRQELSRLSATMDKKIRLLERRLAGEPIAGNR